ncbi:MAG: fused response regulator/phosphatase [Proteobacteria bacterium]|nr:fused response regulator/phosphatase [Pseudomonadota bacterium]
MLKPSVNDRSRILLADDSKISRAVITNFLARGGFKNIDEATDGIDAIEKARLNPPDIILLDIMMPRMNGFEFCRAIREMENLKEVPILVITALSESTDKSSAFSAGATDLITKPFSPEEMIARVQVHLHRQSLLKQLLEYRRVMQAEMRHAKDMQLLLMPSAHQKHSVAKWYSINVHSFFLASKEVSGDLWGIKILSKDKIAIYALDFSGHGVGAALNTFRIHAIINDDSKNMQQDPGTYLCSLNDRLLQLLPTGQFATMFFGVVDIKNNFLNYSAAGYTHPIFYSQEHGKATFLNGSGIPLGVSDHNKYDTRSIPFHPLDSVFLYSDALIESEGRKEDFLNDKEVKKIVEKNLKDNPLSGEKLLANLVEKLTTFTNDKIEDDLTLSLYTRRSE